MVAISSTAPAEASMSAFRQLRRQEMAAAEHVETADNNSSRNSRGRTGPPDGRAAGRRWRRDRQDDLLRRAATRLDEQVDRQPLDHRRIVAHLVIAGRQRPAALQPVQRRLARHRSAILSRRASSLPGEDRHHRVMAQVIVIVEVLIAERQSEHPLADQRLDLVLDQVPAARVAEAGGEPIDETDRPVG